MLLHNLHFFDKNGHSLNTYKEYNLTVNITDDNGSGANLIAITNTEGYLIGCTVISGGQSYTNPSIQVIDKITGNKLTIGQNDIDFSGGVVKSVKLKEEPYGFTYPYMKFSSKLYFENVSEGLHETEHIFILEKVTNNTDDTKEYVRPFSDETLKFIKASGDDNISLFNVEYDTDRGYINKVDEVVLETNIYPSTVDNNFNRSVEILNTEALQVNFVVQGDLEFVFETKFNLTHDDFPFLEIETYAESIMEDERFAMMLSDFGININKQEEKIFRDSDINEDLPNYKILNYKRKEMLLEHSNIFPYLSSYKAITGILSYFGYSDIRIKEYWLNSTNNKLKQVNINNNKPNLLPNHYKKTNYFGLFYDINRTTGSFDEFGIPEVEDVFDFTIEEVLVKLTSLKEYLKKKFLPLNARIIDITGEGVYFEKFSLKVWSDYVERFDVSLGGEIDFFINETNHFLVNTKDFLNTEPKREMLNTDTLSDYYKTYLGNYLTSDVYNDDNTPIGCFVNLSLAPFSTTWNNANVTWNDLIFNGLTPYSNTWETIGDGDFYDLEWKIEFQDSSKYSQSIRKPIHSNINAEFILPYAGKYVISLILYDLKNYITVKTKEIEVKQFESNFLMFSSYEERFETWNEVKNKTWNDISGTFINPSLSHKTKFKDIQASFETLSLQPYIDSKPKIELQENESVYYTMERNVLEGEDFIKLDNFNFTYKTLLGVNRLQINDWIFLKNGEVIIARKIKNIVYSDLVTVELWNEIVLDSYEIYREINNTLILKDVSGESNINVGDWLYIHNQSIDNTVYTVNAFDDTTNKITIDQSIIQKSGDKFEVFQKETYNITNVDTTNYTITAAIDLDKIVLGNTEAIISDGSIEQRVILVSNENVDIFQCIWVDSNPQLLGVNPTITIKYNQFITKLNYGVSVNSDEISVNFYNGVLKDFTEQNGNWFLSKINVNTKHSFSVKHRFNLDDKILLVINDTSNLLYNVDNTFKVSWSEFNIYDVTNKTNVSVRDWNLLSNLTWNDLKNHSWFDYVISGGVKAGFYIKDISPTGKIKFNGYDWFQFQNVHPIGGAITKEIQYGEAVTELNETENKGLNRFNYYLIDLGGNEFLIAAESNNYSLFNLGGLEFENGVSGIYDDGTVSHSFPIGDKWEYISDLQYSLLNNTDRSNPITSTYFSRGVDTFGEKGWFPNHNLPYNLVTNDNRKTDTLNFYQAITPNLNFENLIASDEILEIPVGSTVYFTDDNSRVAGKNLRTWELTKNGEVIMKVVGKYVSYFFNERGVYIMKYNVKDTNGNIGIIEKKVIVW